LENCLFRAGGSPAGGVDGEDAAVGGGEASARLDGLLNALRKVGDGVDLAGPTVMGDSRQVCPTEDSGFRGGVVEAEAPRPELAATRNSEQAGPGLPGRRASRAGVVRSRRIVLG
jgi:hypothetical protein